MQQSLFYLKDSMIMYGINNSDTLETLIDTVHRLHNQATRNEKIVCRKDKQLVWFVFVKKGVGHYPINSLLFLTMEEKSLSKCMKDSSIN